MMFKLSVLIACVLCAIAAPALAQVENYKPVTQEMLLNPSPNDWLMYSRTYDAWRDSPLKQVNKKNVNQLRMAWVRGLGRSEERRVGEGGRSRRRWEPSGR